MFLIFTLRRLDVWPVGDYGVRVGYGRAYGLARTAGGEGPASSRRSLPPVPNDRRLVLLARCRRETASLTSVADSGVAATEQHGRDGEQSHEPHDQDDKG